MDVLTEASKMFQVKYKKMPVLFIDGIDVLAKHDETLVTFLLGHAKYLANQGLLKLVLVSSEGSVIPIIRRFSGANRAPKIFEITDVDNSLATEYLIENGIPDELSMMLINYFGGRLIYMVGSISRYNAYTKLGMTSVTELNDNIIHDLFARKIQDERFAIAEKYPKSHELLYAVSRDRIVIVQVIFGRTIW